MARLEAFKRNVLKTLNDESVETVDHNPPPPAYSATLGAHCSAAVPRGQLTRLDRAAQCHENLPAGSHDEQRRS